MQILDSACHCEEGFSPTTLAPHCVWCSAGEQSPFIIMLCVLVIAVGDGLQRFSLDLDLPRAIDKYY